MENRYIVYNENSERYFTKIKGKRYCWSKNIKKAYVFDDFVGANWIANCSYSKLIEYIAGMAK